MLTDTLPTVQICAYCGGNLLPNMVEDSRLPLCGPSLRIGLVCVSCGNLDMPFPFHLLLKADTCGTVPVNRVQVVSRSDSAIG